jgi:hypothetical protein
MDAHFGFIFEGEASFRLLFIWMRLQRQRLPGCEDLKQERELCTELLYGGGTETCFRCLPNPIVQRDPITIDPDLARSTGMHPHPVFGLRAAGRVFEPEELRQKRTRTPRVVPDASAKIKNPRHRDLG